MPAAMFVFARATIPVIIQIIFVLSDMILSYSSDVIQVSLK
jgi:hypothetical protein